MRKKYKARNFYMPTLAFSSLDELAAIAGLSVPELMPLVRHDVDAYSDHQIANLATGKVREISIPNPKLMHVQKIMLSGMFVPWSMAPAGNIPHAYIRRRSILTAAKQHPNAKSGFKLDIKDFYDSISEEMIVKSWAPIDVDTLPRQKSELINSLAGLATRGLHHKELSWADTYLPQGAPTSGFMSNLVARRIDVSLWKIAWRLRMRVTRYSDDILFTSPVALPRKQLEAGLEIAQGAIEKHGFVVNGAKSRILTPGSRMEVLGVMLGGETPRLSRTKRRKIESEIRGIVKFGLLSHALERHRNPDALYQSLRGYLAFAYPLEKEWAGRQIALLQSAVKDLYASN